MERESMAFDVVIVGAGPAGLACACKLMQEAEQNQQTLSVCVVEKGSEVGAHILSGAVFETTALDELFPNWQELEAPITTQVSADEVFYFASENNRLKIPEFFVPKPMKNHGNFIVSMGNVCRWLATQAENLGVEIYPGFPAQEVLFNDDGSVAGVVTGEMGLDKNGQQKDSFVAGMELKAKYTVFAEGARGHLGKKLIERFELDKNAKTQHYGLGFKEVWEVPAELHKEGLVVHSAGWPLNENVSGGGYLYHGENNQIFVGLIVDLNYTNPYLDPFEEFQRYKHHPEISQYLVGGQRLSYGARVMAKGGFDALPKMTMPGAFLIGCDAGMINFAKIKGNHTSMKSGMLAAETICQQLFSTAEAAVDLTSFNDKFESSWLGKELKASRNFGAVLHKFGPLIGGAYNWVDQNIFGGCLPFSFASYQADHSTLTPSSSSPKIDYHKPDQKISFDKLSSVFLSNTNHEEDQPCHLHLADKTIPIAKNLSEFDEPAQRYCPAEVYEVLAEQGENSSKQFVINSQNCIHCKTCDIKDPSQNITWTAPEGGGGPNYSNM